MTARSSGHNVPFRPGARDACASRSAHTASLRSHRTTGLDVARCEAIRHDEGVNERTRAAPVLIARGQRVDRPSNRMIIGPAMPWPSAGLRLWTPSLTNVLGVCTLFVWKDESLDARSWLRSRPAVPAGTCAEPLGR